MAASIKAQRRYPEAVLGERPAAVGGARLVDPGAEAGVADQLLGHREALDLTDLGGDRVGQYPSDAGRAHEQRHVAVVGAEAPQLGLACADLIVEVLDQAQAGGGARPPGFGQRERVEQGASARAEEVAHRAGVAVGDEARVDARLEGGAVTHEVEAEARARSARTAGLGNQMAGTKSRRASSAST